MRKKILRVITDLFTAYMYYCECGYRTNSKAEFNAHIAQHPSMLAVQQTRTGNRMVEAA